MKLIRYIAATLCTFITIQLIILIVFYDSHTENISKRNAKVRINQNWSNKNISHGERMQLFWTNVDDMINENELFSDRYDVEEVLEQLRTSRILRVTRLYAGTSLKWMLHLEGGAKAIFKPFFLDWKNSDEDRKLNNKCFFGYEQPNSEIASFHVNRLLDTRVVPYTVGRKLSLDKEVWPIADKGTRTSILRRGNLYCVTSTCWQCRKNETMINCPEHNRIYGSVNYWIGRKVRYFPNPSEQSRGQLYHNAYDKLPRFGGHWITETNYCSTFRQKAPYNTEKVFLDVVDGQIIDFLISHYDSKYYAIVDNRSNVILSVRLDYGFAFCPRKYHPIHNTMLSLYQCCQIRRRTYERLLFLRGPTFGEKFKEYTEKEIEPPILTSNEIQFVEKQIEIVLKVISICSIYKDGLNNVLV